MLLCQNRFETNNKMKLLVRSSYGQLAYFSDIFISGKNVVFSAQIKVIKDYLFEKLLDFPEVKMLIFMAKIIFSKFFIRRIFSFALRAYRTSHRYWVNFST